MEEDFSRYCVDCGNKLSEIEYGMYWIICEACVEKHKEK